MNFIHCRSFKEISEKMKSMGGPFKYDGLVWPPMPGIDATKETNKPCGKVEVITSKVLRSLS
jgi:hypothetical protein